METRQHHEIGASADVQPEHADELILSKTRCVSTAHCLPRQVLPGMLNASLQAVNLSGHR